jgi:peroxiredoxin
MMWTKVYAGAGGFLATVFALALLAEPRLRAEEVKLPLITSGSVAMLGGYVRRDLPLSETKPASLKVAPKDASEPLYGELKLGPKEAPTTFLIMVDRPAGKPERLWVDANANGDLTDDPEPPWTPQNGRTPEGTEMTQYSGTPTLTLKIGAETFELRIHMHHYEKKIGVPAAFTSTLFYYADYARVGEITLGGKAHKAFLTDSLTLGDFRGEKDIQVDALFLDVNDDGKFDLRREGFDIKKPFNIGGTTYEIQGMTASGATFAIEKSKETVPETLPAANLAVGQKAPEFEAKRTDGETVKFPAAYKGKLVLLDFWATWCGPCRAEIPNILQALGKYHDRGFEVLGINLDLAAADMTKFAKENKISWPLICDLKLGLQYDAQLLPTEYLVDCDSGKIVATGIDLRGPYLDPTLQKALEKRQGKQSADSREASKP